MSFLIRSHFSMQWGCEGVWVLDRHPDCGNFHQDLWGNSIIIKAVKRWCNVSRLCKIWLINHRWHPDQTKFRSLFLRSGPVCLWICLSQTVCFTLSLSSKWQKLLTRIISRKRRFIFTLSHVKLIIKQDDDEDVSVLSDFHRVWARNNHLPQ